MTRLTLSVVAVVVLLALPGAALARAHGSRVSTDSKAIRDGRVPTGTLVTKPATATNRRVITLDSSGVTGATEMRFRDAGGEWTAWLAFAATYPWTLVGADGLKTIEAEYRAAVDEEPLTLNATIRLDRKRPSTVGYAHEVRRKDRIRLAYKVVDPKPSCGAARVTIRVYRYGRPFTVFKPVVVPTNRKQATRSFRCSWSRGWYTYKVIATDIAGNKQAKDGVGVGVLFVK